ncbi:MAG: T9SS type A sorting domain-containing protein [Calditrichia bacterium]
MKFKLLFLTLLAPVFLFAQVTVTDASINAGETVTWTADNEYLMDGLIYVETGATLNIEAGTVLKAVQNPTNGDNTTALIIARGGKINAVGRANNPIIFTAEGDDLSDPNDLGPEQRGRWGGILVLGNAGLNTTSGVGQIEGIDPNEPRGQYGGGTSPNDADDSGVLKYVSIRHGGALIGPGNEINGLTMGGVGNGTVIEYIEVYSNLDDGYEWFGGTVNAKYLVAAFCGDDAYDWDEGFRGSNQFLLALQSEDAAGRTAEMDGGTDPEDGMPFATPTLANVTYIGPGASAFPNGDGSQMLIFRDNSGGFYYNSIFTDYNGGGGGAGITVEDLSSGEDSRLRLENNQLIVSTNVWWNFGNGNALTDIAPQDFVQTHLGANGNQISDPLLGGISRTNNGGLDPRPSASGPAGSGATAVSDPFIVSVDYIGAFDPSASLWTDGWTAMYSLGFTAGNGMVTLTDASINAGEMLSLTSDNEYLIDGLMYVESGATLNIAAGTVLKAVQNPTNGDNTSALIIARGGKINATGTSSKPIIFTSEDDDIFDPNDLAPEQRGRWGGILVLGNAGLNTTSGVGQIEGIDPNEPRGQYGGGTSPNDADDSGVLRYVSIRHGGALIGPGNEINGLTMGGVGSDTEIEYIEVYSNLDDGFEWFGGTVNAKHLVAAFCGDDAFDWDEGFRGSNQYLFALQGSDNAGRTAEMDGGTDPEDGTPYATPTVANATYIGPGASAFPNGDGSQMLIFRDNSGGFYYNSIFTDYNGGGGGAGITIEDLASGEDSRSRLENNQLIVSTNVWWNFGNGNALTDIAPQDFVQTHLSANGNQIADPQLGAIARDNTNGLDPRPAAAGPAGSGATTVNDPFIDNVDYLGAFDPNTPLWTNGWTALYSNNVTGIVDEQISSVIPEDYKLEQNYPNPFNPSTTIEYQVQKAGAVEIAVFNVAGQKVATLVDGFKNAGSFAVTWNAENLASGLYFYTLKAENVLETRKMILMK